ncbi:putative bifunctional diguanylate cyclase/phosphodiesterase [Planococcus lenghuensis]|uniref:EAL domain-containing protein n=1 Tax=Planococcus lenghuensis TaxID=2213202 RepID=A0A1Q2L0P4_9BACL|nr:EAL domain-containing protein [Planococcus lenghuensis]AQQ53944.1 hypothetical protein B0X71_13140 [Planococcus lenghuensis]
MGRKVKDVKTGLTGKVAVVMLVAVLVVLLLLAAVSTERYENYLLEHIEHELLLKSELTALDISKQLELNGEIARQLAKRPLTADFLAVADGNGIAANPYYSQLNEAVTKIQESSEGIGSVWVSHTEERFLIADHGEQLVETAPLQRPWFEEATNSLDTTYSRPYTDLLTSKPTVSVIHPVIDQEGRLGFVGLDIYLEAILPVLDSIQSFDQQLLILSEEGDVIYDPARLGEVLNNEDLPVGEVQQISTANGLLLAERVQVPTLNWSVISAIPASVALEPIEELRSFSLLVWLVGVVAVLLTILAVLKYLLREIPVLLHDISKAEVPGHQISAALSRGDEVGAIARAVKRLAERIHEQVAEMNYQALYDNLTDMPNRYHTEEVITAAIRKAEESDQVVAIAFLDLDRFKQINDISGHTFGDELLVQFSQRLRNEFMTDETFIGRFSGDEFILVLRATVEDIALLHLHMKELHARLTEPYEVRGQLVYMTATIGVSVYPYDAANKEELLAAADTALSEAKEAGRDRILFFGDDMKQKVAARNSIERGLRTAIDNDELVLHFQPQLDLASGRLNGVETLLRWNHPVQGLISPSEFIPVAEQSGQITSIDEWVMEESIRLGSDLLRQHPEIGTVSVNLNVRQLHDHHLPRKIERLLAFYGYPPEALEIEITESVIVDRINEARRTLYALKAIGIKVALDDFGSGYSSLNYLRILPVDRLKIDRTFISRMAEEPHMQAIVHTVIELAKALDMKVVAEGVEQDEELALLKSWKAESVQGYLVSRPLPFNDLLRFLAARKN